MEKIASPSATARIVAENEFYFKKSLGQNFIIDANILYKIADAAELTEKDIVLEIGPGIGGLTQVLSERAGRVIAVEIDHKLIPVLKKTLAGLGNIEIINGDILKTDIAAIAEKYNAESIKVVANLPYYISTPVIMELLSSSAPVSLMAVMVQKEVAERIVAFPKSSSYGALSVAARYYSAPKLAFVVPPSCFMPRPKVESAVVVLKKDDARSVETKDEALFFRVVKAAFGQRRKTLVNSLKNGGDFNISKERLAELIMFLGFTEKVRGEELSAKDFALLSDLIKNEREKS